VKRFLLFVALAAGCSSDVTGPVIWTIHVSNQWNDTLPVTAWNEANPGQISQDVSASVPPNGSVCLRIDPNTWGTTTASVYAYVPALQGTVVGGVDFSSRSQWAVAFENTPPFFAAGPAFFPC
jgi:hypothetical protein